MSTHAQTDELIHVAGAPNIPGLRFRKFRGDADFPEMVRVFNGVNRAAGIKQVSTVESLSAVTFGRVMTESKNPR